MAKCGVLVVFCICLFVACVIETKRTGTRKPRIHGDFICEERGVCKEGKADEVKECYNKLPDKYKKMGADIEKCDGNLLYENPKAFFCKNDTVAAHSCYRKVTHQYIQAGVNSKGDEKKKFDAYEECIYSFRDDCLRHLMG